MTNNRTTTAAVAATIWATAIALALCCWACGGQKNDARQGQEPIETATTGKVELLCDESLYKFMKPSFALFDSAYPEASVTVKPAAAREAMAQLFSGKARGVIIAREYLRDEDSLMKAYKVEPHAAIIFAQDALVFYAKPDFPLDTLSLDQAKQILTDKSASFKKFFPNLKAEPTVYCPEASSSEYGNALLALTGGKAAYNLRFLSDADSVRAAVERSTNAIGVGYLSRLAGEANIKAVKLLKIGFRDSTGKYIAPKPVHQSYVVMGKYPLAVKIRGLLLEDRHTSLPWGFFTFIRNDNKTKEYFLKSGIVPDNARFTLRQEEE